MGWKIQGFATSNMQPIDHLQASSIHLKVHNCYYQFSLSKTARLAPFPGYYGRPTRSAKSFSRTGPTEVSIADVPTPLPVKEHTMLPIQNTARAAGRTTGPHRLCSSATPPPTRIEFSSFGEVPPPPPQPPSPPEPLPSHRRTPASSQKSTNPILKFSLLSFN